MFIIEIRNEARWKRTEFPQTCSVYYAKLPYSSMITGLVLLVSKVFAYSSRFLLQGVTLLSVEVISETRRSTPWTGSRRGYGQVFTASNEKFLLRPLEIALVVAMAEMWLASQASYHHERRTSLLMRKVTAATITSACDWWTTLISALTSVAASLAYWMYCHTIQVQLSRLREPLLLWRG